MRRVVGAVALLVLVAPAAFAATLRGGFDNDRIVGSPKADTIRGGYGADRLFGRGGGDRILGESGADVLRGEAGADTLSGGFGRDLLHGDRGADTLKGDFDDDRLLGGAGNDRLGGGQGDDRLDGGTGADVVDGADGDDRIASRDGAADTVICGDGDDTVVADLIDRVSADCENVTPPQAKPEGSTRERPFPGGPHPTLDGWQLEVLGSVPDATGAVLAENQFNSPPPPGEVFSIARVRATRTAAGSDSFGGSYRLRVVGSAAVVYTTFEHSCGVIPDELPSAQVFTGGAVEGNVCWSVPAGEVSSLVLVDSPVAFGDRQSFFALR